MLQQTDFGRPFLHPLHALLLSFPVALFSCALLADITYLNTAVVQWSHFAAWLVTGGVLFGGVVLAWAVVLFVALPRGPRHRRAVIYLVAVGVMWLAGMINAFQHSRDAWSSVGTLGLTLSLVSTACALLAGVVGHGRVMRRETAR